MGFNKNKGLSVVAVLIVLVIANVVGFLLPTIHNITFWLGYSFATLAVLLMLAVVLFFFNSADKYQSFLRLSLVKIAWIYFVLQVVVAVGQMLNITIPYLSALIADCCITGFFLILVLFSHIAVEGIEKQEEEVNQKVLFLQNIQVMLQSIKSDDATLSSKIKNLTEDFQFSDPMSHSMLAEVESQIEAKVMLLKADASDVSKASADIDIISSLLQDRNAKCKMLKSVKEPKKEKDNSGVRYVTVAVGVIGLTATVALTVCFWIIPNNKYNFAMSLYEAERYPEAVVAFETIKGFRNSDEMLVLSQEAVKETVYQEAKELMANEQYVEAIAVLEKLGTYKDSKDLIELSQENIRKDKYSIAEAYFNEQNYVEAIKVYTELGDYKDAKQKIEQIYNRISDEDGVVYYGSYLGTPIAWEIAEKKSDRLMLITKDAICELPYNDELKNVEWSESTLCTWLNTEFVKSFSEEQAESILPTKIDGVENKVFLLSQKEVKAIKDSAILKCDKEWWICTQSKNNALFVNTSGKVNKTGENVVKAKGVRPVIWLSLE